MVAPGPKATDLSHLELRRCAWCEGPIRRAARRDARTCSKACRQAKARFKVSLAPAATTAAMRFAYADPPYPGMARKYYGTVEVNHELLIGTLEREYPSGWALSTSAAALQHILSMCPAGVRVACWVRGARPGKSWFPRVAWEPLIVSGGRPRRIGVAEYSRDVLVWGGRQNSHPGALIGMKSAAFAEWVFEQLGAQRGDSLDDIFPGSGIISRAWGAYQREPPCRGDTSPRGIHDSCYGGAVRRLDMLLEQAATGTGATGATPSPHDTSRHAGDARHLHPGTQND